MSETDETFRVLHVDDEPDFADTAAAFLEREDERFAVGTATSAGGGLDLLSSGRVDCVVSDYDMPERNGIEFLETVREEYPDLPFVLFTGKGSEEVASEAISAGVSDYLQKTGGTDQYAVLANRIANLVEKYRAERARERHHVLVEEATDAILVVGGDATVRYATPSSEAILGRTPEELVGTSGFEPIHPDDRDRVVEEFAGLVDRPGGYRTVEFRYERPDGSWIWAEARGRNLEDRSVVDGLVVYVRDVTDRKERGTELQYKSRAMDEAPVGITISDPTREDNPLVYTNDRFTALTGYEEREAVGRNCRFLQGEGTDPERITEIREAIDAERPAQVELRNYRKDGTEFWNRVTVAPIRDDAGELANFVGFQEDVTDRKERERALQRERDRFRAVFEDSFDPMVIADDDGRYVEVNDRATELFGYPEEELLGRSIREFAPDGVDVGTAWTEFRTSNGERGTFPLVRPDGTERVVEYAATANITPGEHLSVLRDVTDRERRERDLRRYERIVNTMQEAACIYDREGRFEVVNDHLASFYGTTPESLVGEPSSLLPRIREEHGGDPYRELLDGEREELEGEVEGEFPGHGYEVLAYRLVPLEVDGEIEGVVGVAHEITDHRRREAELERRNERLDEFASLVSHDLQNPLDVAEGRLELASEECSSEHLDAVGRAHERMRTLIEDMLALARGGTRVADVEPVPLAEVVPEAWGTAVAGEAALAIEAERTIRADASRLQQLFVNLFGNAVAYGGRDVTVTVGDLDGGFYVADDGPGVPADERERVFETGYSGTGDGHGLGLAIVREIAGAHGWDVRLTESADGGARFEFTGVEDA